MSDDEQKPDDEVSDDVKTWNSARDRIIRFARNIITFERTVDRLVTNQAKQQDLLSDLNNRVQRDRSAARDYNSLARARS